MANLLDQASIVLTPTAYDNGKVLCAKPSEPPYGDFDFSRNSAATRVNAQGLVENVQILSSNLVQNGDFSEEGVQEVSNGSFSQEGVQLITNGDFSSDTNWVKGAGWSISGGSANGSSTTGDLYQENVVEAGKYYKITYTISNYVGGSVRVELPNNAYAGTDRSANGTYTEILLSNGTIVLFDARTSFTGSIDNVSVREVGQDWNLSSQSEIVEDAAKVVSTDGSFQYIKQNGFTSTQGKTIKFTIEVTDIQIGQLKVSFTGGTTNTNIPNSVGTHILYIPNDGSIGELTIGRVGGATDVTITNISVKEVGQNWTLGTGWSIGNDVAISDTTASNLTPSTVLISGEKYKFTLDVAKISAGSFTFILRFNGTNTTFATINTEGSFTFYATADATGFRLQNLSGGTTDFSVTNITAVQITDDTNLPRINYENFSYQDALGSEEIVNGTFDSDTAWGKFDNTTIDNGKLILAVTTSGTKANQSNVMVVGKSYKVVFNVSDYVDGNVYISGFSIPLSERTSSANGTFTFYSEATSTTFTIGTTSSATNLSIDNVSVKEYLGQEVVPDSGCGSWLFEPQSTNLVTYSEDLNLSLSSQVDATITNNFGVSPSGQSNSSRIQFADATAFCYGAINISTTHTASVYVKGTSGETISFGIGANVTSGGLFTFNGLWQRIEFTASSAAQIFLSSYSGATATDFEAFGLQLEALSYATSYIPTSGSSVTRNQDLCTNGGSLASINSTEGTLYFEGAALRETNDNTQFLSLGSGSYTSNSVYLQLRSSPNQFAVWAYSNNINQFAEIISVTDITDFNKIAISYKLNDFKVYVNGSVVYTNTTYTPPTDNSLNVLEFTRDGSLPFFGKTKALAVWKEALSDQELADLTYPTPTDPTFALDFDTIATDFTFARGSEATYVDAQGLIQSTNEIGEELVVNGSFDSDTDWNKNGTITISGGTANFNNSASGNNVEQAVTLPSGKQYIATYEITSITEGKFSIYVGGVLSGNQNNQVGVYTEVFTSIGGNAVYVRARGTTTGSIDNVSVKEYTTATNTPRLDYSTGAEAFLLEPQSTNLVTQSELLNGYWSNSGSNNLISEVISPDGISFSQKVTTNSAGNFKGLLKNEGTIWDSKTLTISTFAKKGNTDWLYFYNIGSNNGNNGVWFNLDSGLIGTIGAAWSNVKIETFQNGWYRCSATLSFGAATNYLYILNSDANNSVFSTLDNYAYIWGTQIEENNISSYIPTSGSTVTRNQETCINATPEINSEEGVLYFEGSALVETDTSNRHISISGGSNNDRLYFYYSQSGRFSFASFVGGVLQANITYDGVILNNSKIACKYKENDYSLWVDGVEVGTDTSASVWSSGTLDRINFAEPNGISSLFYGNTKDIQVYTKALSDAELIKLTT